MKDSALHSVRGFTLVEMLVVISIIVVLLTIVVGVTHIVLARASTEQTKTNMQIILQAIEAYSETDESGVCPPTTGGDPTARNVALYTALKINPAARKKLAALPGDATLSVGENECFVDGFAVVLDYSSDGGVGGTPVLISAGSDGEFDTEKDIRSDGR